MFLLLRPILRRHLLKISKICNELGLQPTVFYGWQKELRATTSCPVV